MKQRHTILVCDDEKTTVVFIISHLELHDYNVIYVASGEEAVSVVKEQHVDLILMDVRMPIDGEMSNDAGFFAAKAIKDWDSNIPIIFLSARLDNDAQKHGIKKYFDFLAKIPSNTPEVIMAKIEKAIEGNVPEHLLQTGGIILDTEARAVFVYDCEINLTDKEYTLFYYLMSNMGKMMTHDEIYNYVWPERAVSAGDADKNAIGILVNRVRDKIRDDAVCPEYLVNIPGRGYRIEKRRATS